MKDKIGNKLLASLNPAERLYEVFDTELPGFCLRVQPSGVMTYYARYRLPTGERGRIRIGSASALTPAQARDEAKKKLAEASLGVDPSAKKRSKAPTLGQFIDNEYRPVWLKSKKSGAATYDRIRRCFGPFWNKKLDRITAGLLDKWRAERLSEGTAASTVNRDVATLRAALSKAVDWDYLPQHPLSKLKPIKENQTPIVRYLEQGEEFRLMDALDRREARIREGRASANAWRRERGYAEMTDLSTQPFADHLKPMVIVSLNTGLRRGELFSLMWTEVNLDKAILTVKGESSKNSKARHIPLNSAAKKTLQAWKTQSGDGGFVFKNESGGRFDNVQTSWERVLADAEIPSFRWHDMRHHFASWLVMLGENLNTVRELLGHSDLKMTLRYAHLAPEHKAAAVAKLDSKENIIPFKSASTLERVDAQ